MEWLTWCFQSAPCLWWPFTNHRDWMVAFWGAFLALWLGSKAWGRFR
jgi:hypothetical protein